MRSSARSAIATLRRVMVSGALVCSVFAGWIVLGAALVGSVRWVAAETGAARSGSRAASSPRLFVIQPGAPGSTDAAEPFMKRLAAYLSARGEGTSAGGLSAIYFNETAAAIAAVRERRKSQPDAPSLGVVSIGFYLGHRVELGLEPLLEFLPEGRYFLMAPASAERDAKSLAEQQVAGGVLDELRFVARVVFAEIPGVDRWRGVPTTRISRALRKLESGEYGAAVIHSRERATLDELGKLDGLAVLAQSESLPAAVLVRFGDPAKAIADVVAGVFTAMPRDEEGQSLLKDMSCDGTRAVRTEWLEGVEKRYDERTK